MCFGLRASRYITLSKTHIWTARIWIIQLHRLSRIHDHMVHKQTAAGCSETGHCHQTEVLHVAAPLTSLSRMPWVRLPAEPNNKVWPACFFFFLSPDRIQSPTSQTDRSSTVQPPSGTQDGLCLRVSNTSFRTRKNSSPQKTFNWWRLMSMRTSLRYSSPLFDHVF